MATKIENKESPAVVPEQPNAIPNPSFYFGSDTFVLENDDTYDGGYCCHKTGLVWREGDGTYTTKDGHIYQGLWENDQLLNSEYSTIIYPSGVEYYGGIANSQYSGNGTYILPNKLRINSQFEENKPTEEVILTDFEGYLWKGLPEGDHVLLLPTNHFFDTIPPTRGIGKIKPKKLQKSKSLGTSKKSVDMDELEKRYFGKSTKTLNEFSLSADNIEDEIVFRKPSRSEIHRTSVLRSAMFLGPDPKEAESKSSSHISISLLKTFLSKSYRTKNEPVMVITPTVDIEANFDKDLREEALLNELNKNTELADLEKKDDDQIE